jgi:formyltetrahydrofolate deformylase
VAAKEFVLTLVCPDVRGIVHTVTGYLVERDANIVNSAQFGDPETGVFSMRIHFAAEGAVRDLATLKADFEPIAARFAMQWEIWDCAVRPRVLILVSQQDHCLHDLLYRYQVGELRIDIPAVVSNHRAAYKLVAAQDIPYHHWPVTAASRERQEEKLHGLIAEERIDFIVLARYMQVLSPPFCALYPGRILNIHHSFLPGFKGARPYAQAHARGVKLIGATAHYVTADLDEGPIIEQDVERVDHSMSSEQLAAVGRDVEKLVLARAVRYQAERRVVLTGNRTVVFR